MPNTAVSQTLRHLLQQAVTEAVAKRVIDLFEAVEVDENHGHRRVPRSCVLKSRIKRCFSSNRFGSPVSASCVAWCASWSVRLRWLMAMAILFAISSITSFPCGCSGVSGAWSSAQKAYRSVDLIVQHESEFRCRTRKGTLHLSLVRRTHVNVFLVFPIRGREEVHFIGDPFCLHRRMSRPDCKATVAPLRQHPARNVEDLAAGTQVIGKQILQSYVICRAQSMQQLQIAAEAG